jgi:hypothetical protein
VAFTVKSASRTRKYDEAGTTARARQLVAAPDRPQKSYVAVASRFERLAKQNSWTNDDGSIYPVSLANLQRYVAFHKGSVKPQSLKSYLSALKEKHEQLGFLEWDTVRFHCSIIRMLKNVKRNHMHTEAKRSKPITRELLRQIKKQLNFTNP